MSLVQLIGSVELGLIYGLVGVGVYLSFRVLNFPDMSVDGSFVTGITVTAIMITSGFNSSFATLLAFLSGSGAGLITALLHVRWRIFNLLSGILVMTALTSINLRIMGAPNLSLSSYGNIFTETANLLGMADHQYFKSLVLVIIIALIVVILYRFMRSEIGLAMRAAGNNPACAQASGVSVNKSTFLALAISNGLIALAGSFYAQANNFADVTSGMGTIVVGLASVIIGETFCKKRRSVLRLIIACFAGSLLHRLVIAASLNVDTLGLRPSDVNFVTAALIVLFIILPKYARQRKTI